MAGLEVEKDSVLCQLVGLISLSPALKSQVLKWKSLHLSHHSAVDSDAAGFYIIWVCNRASPRAVLFPKNVAKLQEQMNQVGVRQGRLSSVVGVADSMASCVHIHDMSTELPL